MVNILSVSDYLVLLLITLVQCLIHHLYQTQKLSQVIVKIKSYLKLSQVIA